MEKKINIAELLKDCPKGMELYSPIFGKVYFDKIRPHLAIVVTTDKEQGDFKEEFLYDGRYGMNGECMLFPSKDQRDWSKFQRPFKYGDIVVTTSGNIAIIRKPIGEELFYVYGLMFSNGFYKDETVKVFVERLATEEEKQKLFDAIKKIGYRWNAETKTLEKLVEPRFKVGDMVVRDDYYVEIIEIDSEEEVYNYESEVGGIGCILFSEQDNWKLSPNKFDITALKPFDKVLVRDNYKQEWVISLFSHCNGLEIYKYSCINGSGYSQCIPYEGNEHLLGTTCDCDDYYKTWE
jgi:hypothetical protein